MSAPAASTELVNPHGDDVRYRGKTCPVAHAAPMSPPLSPQTKTAVLDEPIEQIDLPKSRSDNYVQRTVDNQEVLPPITWSNLLENIQWVSVLALTITPAIALYGMATTTYNNKTFFWCIGYYLLTGMSITAGYHRLWAHRSYIARKPLQYSMAIFGCGAVQGSIKWWSRGHRAHHRYTDTDLDPYNAHRGFFYSHVGWMLVKPRRAIGTADVSDLSKTAVVRWQQKWYLYLIVIMGFIFPTLVAGLGWGDWRGGFFFAGAARLCFVHHSTFCVNSLAHWIGDQPFDDKHTPRNSFITALVTNGEGYHNFHHQFPLDFRNAIIWYQYDPTKWFIWLMSKIGQASQLKTFPMNEIRKGQYTMKLQKLRSESEDIKWPSVQEKMPVVSWDDFVSEAKDRPLVAIGGYIHELTDEFIDEHPGGRHFLIRAIGTDASSAFHGGVYDHSNAAHNLLSMMRVGILEGGMEVEHLKSGFETSSINPDRKPPTAPPAQPQATVYHPETLHLSPSERLRIEQVHAQKRKSKEDRTGTLKGAASARSGI